MAFTGPAEDQFAIRALIDRYADAVFRRDGDDWGACWADDGDWHLMGTQVTGRPAIVRLWLQAMAGFAFVAFFSQPGSIVVEGDGATGTVYTHEVLETLDGKISRPVGQYLDRYVKREGAWLFAERRYTLLKEG